MNLNVQISSLILGSLLLVSSLPNTSEIKIQSKESKTMDGQPVYNSIKLIRKKNKDIWMMNQSHFGQNPDPKLLDRLVIIVDTTINPKTAEFYQLPAGKLEWSDDLRLKKIDYKVSCFMCHANGPRVIRPDYEKFNVNTMDQLKIKFWNYKISRYGRITVNESENQNEQTPFRYKNELDNQKLNIKTCSKCHNEKDSRGRGSLVRQNLLAIQYLVEHQIMPPTGYEMSDSEKKYLNRFIKGFE